MAPPGLTQHYKQHLKAYLNTQQFFPVIATENLQQRLQLHMLMFSFTWNNRQLTSTTWANFQHQYYHLILQQILEKNNSHVQRSIIANLWLVLGFSPASTKHSHSRKPQWDVFPFTLSGWTLMHLSPAAAEVTIPWQAYCLLTVLKSEIRGLYSAQRLESQY